MKQQGADRGREDDWWWRELYGEETGAGGEDGASPPPAASDTLDDRIESALRTVGRRPATNPPGATGTPPTGPDQRQSPAAPEAPASGDFVPQVFEPRPWEPSAWEPRPWELPARPAPTPPGPAEPLPLHAKGPATAPTPPPAPSVPPSASPAPPAPPPAAPPAAYGFPAAHPDALDGLVPDTGPVPDTVLDGAGFGSVAVRAVSQRGDDARQRGEVRGEAFLTAGFGTGRDALLLVAVAVGPPGTGEAAHRAARHVCAWAGDAVGRNSTRLAQDLRTGRRDALKAGLRRLADHGYGKLRGRAGEPGAAPDAHPAALRCLLLPADPDCRTRVFFGVGGGGLFRLRDGGWEDLEPTAAPAQEYPTPAAYAAQDAADGRSDGLPARAPSPDPDPAPAPTAPAAPIPAVPYGADGVAFRPASFRFRTVSGRPGDVLLLCGTGLAAPLSGDPDFAARLAAAWSVPGPPDLADFLPAVQPRGAGGAKDRTAVGVWES